MNFFKKPISPKLRNILITASYVFLTALFFTAGYSVGYYNGGGMLTSSVTVETIQTEPPMPATPSPTVSPVQYRVILEDGELRLYEDTGETSKVISHEKISEWSFPSYDMDTLKEGRIFLNIEDAVSLMENFLS